MHNFKISYFRHFWGFSDCKKFVLNCSFTSCNSYNASEHIQDVQKINKKKNSVILNIFGFLQNFRNSISEIFDFFLNFVSFEHSLTDILTLVTVVT